MLLHVNQTCALLISLMEKKQAAEIAGNQELLKYYKEQITASTQELQVALKPEASRYSEDDK